MSHRPRLLGVGSLAILVAMSIGAPVASAGPKPPPAEKCEKRDNDTEKKLLECVTLSGVREHQAALQAIATANGGTRRSGTPGFDASAQYVFDRMTAAGYTVTTQEFQYPSFTELAPTVLEQVSPAPMSIPNIVMEYSGSGDVVGSVTVLADATPGCEAGDFGGFPGGNIALIRRGACPFATKVTNAFNAGAIGVVIYNNIDGNLSGTLGSGFNLDIPATGITASMGEQLATTSGLTLHLKASTLREIVTTRNVFAESKRGDPDNVVMVGAHLDSVGAGPGINDNGSGSAAILETAEQLANFNPKNKLRFAWWAAEEANLVGSTFYVNSLSAEDLGRIALYLNFDMVGSPNSVFFVYDGDDSDAVGAGPGPDGSAAIEKTFESFYMSRGEPFKGTDFSGRSDYGPFIANGVPSGGLFTGAEGIKTAEEAVIWGGTAGQAYDPCYHQACDTYANNRDHALDVNADAIASATLKYAKSTFDVNGLGKPPKDKDKDKGKKAAAGLLSVQ